MAEKIISIDTVGDVYFFKRRGAKSVRVKVDSNGRVVVTLPIYMPYKLAEQFVKQHHEWLNKEKSDRTVILHDGLIVGRIHTLRYIKTVGLTKPAARVTASQIIVKYSGDIEDNEVQKTAIKACIRSLRREAEHFLPKRLKDIAMAQGYDYKSVCIKQLTGRWGSCDQSKNITLNLFLMQLPLEYIDYVILHELAHTRAMHHGPDFWKELEKHLPNARELKKLMKQYQPTVPARK